MRMMLSLLVAALVALGVSACGSSSKKASASASTSQTSQSSTSSPATVQPGITTPSATTNSSSSSSSSSSPSSSSASAPGAASQESAVEREESNPDHVDPSITGYGKQASSGETAAITTLVKSYYGAISSGQDAKACQLLSPGVRKTLMRLLASAKRRFTSCAEILPALLGQARSSALSKPAEVEVTSFRVQGDHGFAIVKTKTLPAGVMNVRRINGTWTMGSLIGTPAP